MSQSGFAFDLPRLHRDTVYSSLLIQRIEHYQNNWYFQCNKDNGTHLPCTCVNSLRYCRWKGKQILYKCKRKMNEASDKDGY